jgi:hypothetical protein
VQCPHDRHLPIIKTYSIDCNDKGELYRCKDPRYFYNEYNCSAAPNQAGLDDGVCDQENNYHDCYDFGDCTPHSCIARHGFVQGSICDFSSFPGTVTSLDPRFQHDCMFADNPEWLGDGWCDDSENNYDLCADAGDCCKASCGAFDPFPTFCYLDKYVCRDPVFAPVNVTSACAGRNDVRLGNSICDPEFNTPECNYDSQDCCLASCQPRGSGSALTEDGIVYGDCSTANFMTCLDPRFKVNIPPQCVDAAFPTLAGNGRCEILNLKAPCWDGGDCANSSCVSREFQCGTQSTMCGETEESLFACSGAPFQAYDPAHADPLNCPDDPRVGDGICQPELNTLECQDGHDCGPTCSLHRPWQSGGSCDVKTSVESVVLSPLEKGRLEICRNIGVPFPELLGDGNFFFLFFFSFFFLIGICQPENNVMGCHDMFDCCPETCGFFGNGTNCGVVLPYACTDPLFRSYSLSCGNDPRIGNGFCDCDLNEERFCFDNKDCSPTSCVDRAVPEASGRNGYFVCGSNGYLVRDHAEVEALAATTVENKTVPFPLLVGDGTCDIANAVAGGDGGDCCENDRNHTQFACPAPPVRCMNGAGKVVDCLESQMNNNTYHCLRDIPDVCPAGLHLFCANNETDCNPLCCPGTCQGEGCDKTQVLETNLICKNPQLLARFAACPLNDARVGDKICNEDLNYPGCYDHGDCCAGSCGFFTLQEGTFNSCGSSNYPCVDPMFRQLPAECATAQTPVFDSPYIPFPERLGIYFFLFLFKKKNLTP